ncbi:MAG: DUF4159 domain-containing protein [Elusimicrobia bacterium]|nr:DUF4159 domain-containing protein [Elusimicrobiota bacterium]
MALMTFTFPALLWALPLAASPLLLHLLSRRQATRVLFSDLRLLRQIQSCAKPLSRLQQWLLIAARCLALLLLILAYAGPVLTARDGSPSAAAPQGLDLVLLLDSSYSMGYRERGKTRFEVAKNAAEPLIRSLNAADRIAFGSFSNRLETADGKLSWLTPQQALEALGRSRLGFQTTDYEPALRASSELLSREPARRRAVLLLTDGAAHGLRREPPALEPGVIWLGLTWPKAENSYLIMAGPSRQSRAKAAELLVRGGVGTGNSTVDLWVEGRKAQSGNLAGGSRLGDALGFKAAERSAVLPLPSSRDTSQASWEGHVALRADFLSVDDVYYFSFRHPTRPRALCLYANPDFFRAPQAGYFLKEILGGSGESLLDYDFEFMDLARFDEIRSSDYRVIILADFKQVPPAAAAELDRFVKRGGSLWLLPGSQTTPESFDELQGLPAQVGPPVSGEQGIKPGPAADARLWSEFELGKVVVAKYFLLQVRPSSEVVFKSAGGYPLLVQGRRGEGQIAVWASPLDAGSSNLALKPAFAAWLQSGLDRLSGRGAETSQSFDLKTGEPLRRVWGPKEPAPASVVIRAPDGHSTTLWVKDRSIEYLQTQSPGLYALLGEAPGKRRAYAVNLDRSSGEGELKELEDPPWRTVAVESLASDFHLKVYGRDARSAALALAALVLVLEMFLAMPKALAVLMLLMLPGVPALAQQGDRFIWTQIRHGAQWDPYPDAHQEALGMMSTVTSVLTAPERRVVSLKDKSLFFSPILVLSGRSAPPSLEEEEVRQLRNYLSAGGLLWIEDASGSGASSFDAWVRRTLSQVLPESPLQPLDPEHVVFRTFFLLRGVGGRVSVRSTIEGAHFGGRTAVLYSRNDLLGIWLKDALGNPLFPCVPGGEVQRQNGKKLVLNIVMYALTGNYKADAVHQPYILQKMRSTGP